MNPPQYITIFGRNIYLYGIIIAIGFLLAFAYGFRRVRQFGLTSDQLTDAILFAVPMAIVGARLYYVIFYWELFRDDPISILYIWNGGLAIYGGVIGAVLGLLLFSKIKKVSMLPCLDIAGLGLLIGQSVGRWGNFTNREAYGAQIFDDFFLRMGLTGANGVTTYWHPTFLYESVWNLIGFVILHFASKKRKYDGKVFLLYLAWYGLGRAWIEGLRTDSLWLFGTGIRVSQLLAAVSCLGAIGVMLYIHFVKKPDGSGMLVNRIKAADAESAEAQREQTESAEAEAEESAEAQTEQTTADDAKQTVTTEG